MARQVKKHAQMSIDVICPKIRERLEKLRFKSVNCYLNPSLDGNFQIDIYVDRFCGGH